LNNFLVVLLALFLRSVCAWKEFYIKAQKGLLIIMALP